MYEVRVKQIVPKLGEIGKEPCNAIDEWVASFRCEADAESFIEKKRNEYAEANNYAFDGYSPIWYLLGDVHYAKGK